MSQRNRAEFRFYQELNDFLPAERKKVAVEYEFDGSPAVKDAIEAIGVPHPEVDLIIVDRAPESGGDDPVDGPACAITVPTVRVPARGPMLARAAGLPQAPSLPRASDLPRAARLRESVSFSYRLQNGDRVAVYPVFESFDISPINRLRPEPLRVTRFILDVHLGKLARVLRLLGFDTEYERGYDDAEIARRAGDQRRIILTRDRGLLKRGSVTHGYWVRSQVAEEQAREVITRFDLRRAIRPFTRCLVCNGTIGVIRSDRASSRVPERSRGVYSRFFECKVCSRIYWRGTHITALTGIIERIVRT